MGHTRPHYHSTPHDHTTPHRHTHKCASAPTSGFCLNELNRHLCSARAKAEQLANELEGRTARPKVSAKVRFTYLTDFKLYILKAFSASTNVKGGAGGCAYYGEREQVVVAHGEREQIVVLVEKESR